MKGGVHRFSIFKNLSDEINQNKIYRFKSRIGINLGLNAGVGYGITPRLRARLSARYYKSLTSVLEHDSRMEQKYASLGLRCGLGYQF